MSLLSEIVRMLLCEQMFPSVTQLVLRCAVRQNTLLPRASSFPQPMEARVVLLLGYAKEPAECPLPVLNPTPRLHTGMCVD
jgi:hypothetical protein